MGTLNENGDPESDKGPHGSPGPQTGTHVGAVPSTAGPKSLSQTAPNSWRPIWLRYELWVIYELAGLKKFHMNKLKQWIGNKYLLGRVQLSGEDWPEEPVIPRDLPEIWQEENEGREQHQHYVRSQFSMQKCPKPAWQDCWLGCPKMKIFWFYFVQLNHWWGVVSRAHKKNFSVIDP